MAKLTKDSQRIRKTLRRFDAKKNLFDMTALGACFDLGLLEKTGEDKDGDPIWELTDAGRLALQGEQHDD